MKLHLLIASMAAMSVMLFTACHSGHADHDGHDHDEAAEGHDGHDHNPDDITFTAAQAKAAGLATETIRPADFADALEVSGRVLPATGAEATVSATMAGIVRYASTALAEGAAVSGGQQLFIVNAQPMADGNPAAVAQSELAAARQAYERTQQLAADHVVSQRELEDARLRYETARATAQSLGSAAQTRGIASPIGGYVKALLVKPGDYVAAGQPLATVTQSRRVQLRADVPERFYSVLPRITSARFRMAYDGAQRVYTMSGLGGRLVSRGKAAGTDDFFVPVTFEFDNRGDIVSGSLAQVWLVAGKRSGVLSVPTAAVTEAQGLHFVYVQVGAEEYRRREVRLGATDGLRTEITSGLKAGDKVVVAGATQLRLAANAAAVPEGHSH